MAHILVLHGPNLNLLGEREPQHYGGDKLSAIDRKLLTLAEDTQHELSTFQSNSESVLVDKIQDACSFLNQRPVGFIIFNPAAFTHTSIALRDALLAVKVKFIEVHLSNPLARESFRRHSYFSDIAMGVISGFGALSYELALTAIINYLAKKSQ